MRIPFPYDLRIGTDIIRLSRLPTSQKLFHKLVLRVLQTTEQRVLDERFPAWKEETVPENSAQERKRREWLGGRWAAKEAAKKAWGASLLSFRDLRIEADSDGGLEVICALPGKDTFGACWNQQAAKVSISHDGEYAAATVLASPLNKALVTELGRRKAEARKNVTPPVQHISDGPP